MFRDEAEAAYAVDITVEASVGLAGITIKLQC